MHRGLDAPSRLGNKQSGLVYFVLELVHFIQLELLGVGPADAFSRGRKELDIRTINQVGAGAEGLPVK
jgi:hypothetical protein